MFTLGFTKVAKEKYEWLYHGTTPSATKQILVGGIDPKHQGTGLGAPDKLGGKNVISYTRNKDVGLIYSRQNSLWDIFKGETKQEPLLVRVPVNKGFKEVTPDWVHQEIHSTEKIPVKWIILPKDPRYKKTELLVRRGIQCSH